jgi:hypothetical protein
MAAAFTRHVKNKAVDKGRTGSFRDYNGLGTTRRLSLPGNQQRISMGRKCQGYHQHEKEASRMIVWDWVSILQLLLNV